jgi:hypothetical protein
VRFRAVLSTMIGQCSLLFPICPDLEMSPLRHLTTRAHAEAVADVVNEAILGKWACKVLLDAHCVELGVEG